MPLLYEPDEAQDSFVLTPEYDALIAEWENSNPEHPDPRFSTDECRPFAFRWPPNESPRQARRRAARKSNGQFAKKE